MAKIILSILSNLIIVGGTGYTVWWFWHVHSEGQTTAEKRKIFRYFTYLSNIFSAFTSAVILIAELILLSRGETSLPEGIVLLRFMGASCVAVTMLTVVAFLAPTLGWKEMYKEDGFYMHVVGPALAVLSFSVWEKDTEIRFPLSLLGAVFVVLYIFLYLYKVLIKGEENGGWPDFYGFNQKPGMWKISLPAMIAGSCVVSLLMAFLHNL